MIFKENCFLDIYCEKKLFLLYVKVALSFSINKILENSCFKKLAYYYYNKMLVIKKSLLSLKKTHHNIGLSEFILPASTKNLL